MVSALYPDSVSSDSNPDKGNYFYLYLNSDIHLSLLETQMEYSRTCDDAKIQEYSRKYSNIRIRKSLATKYCLQIFFSLMLLFMFI